MLGLLADVEGCYRPMVTHHPRPDLARLAFGYRPRHLVVICVSFPFILLHLSLFGYYSFAVQIQRPATAETCQVLKTWQV